MKFSTRDVLLAHSKKITRSLNEAARGGTKVETQTKLININEFEFEFEFELQLININEFTFTFQT